jgi:hypothetical protein
MQISCFNHSKYRSFEAPGEDVLLVLPGLYALFDGATDPTKTMLDGVTSGRFAALTCAEAVSRLWVDQKLAHDDQLLHQVNDQLELVLLRKIVEGQLQADGKPPSTTMVLAWDIGDELLFFLLGDSGVRLNGQEEIILRKQVDTVSTLTRLTLFRLLQEQGLDGDELEYQAREVVYYGLDKATEQRVLTGAQRQNLLESIKKNFPKTAREGMDFLQQGVVSQHHFANQGELPLGYAALNGKSLAGEGMLCFSRPKSAVQSLELFTDGYFSLPNEVTVASWEEEFERVEAADPSKIESCPAIKGSTSTEFSDDRSVLIVQYA